MEEILEFHEPKRYKFQHQAILNYCLNFLVWASPFLGLGIFFPIGVLILFLHNKKLREAAFQSITIQLFVIAVCYPVDLISMYNEWGEQFANKIKVEYIGNIASFWALFGLAILFFEARSIVSRKKNLSMFNQSGIGAVNEKEFSLFKTLIIIVLIWLLSIFWFVVLNVIFFYLQADGQDLGEAIRKIDFKGESSLLIWLITIYSSSATLGRKGVLAIFRKPYLSFCIHSKLSETVVADSSSTSFQKKSKYAKIREFILPGLGHIYLRRYWKGFSLLFSFLLVLLFFSTALTFYIDPVFGIKFLTSFGLKVGIPDKEFIKYVDNIIYPISFFIMLSGIYTLSQFMLRTALKNENEPFEERGLQTGFSNNVYFSLLAHLILLSVILIIPISVQRNSSAKKKQDISKQHFTPEKMEFYFIDPDIPDQVKDLNGGVVSGTETPSKNQGEKIPNKLAEDEGKVKGYVKRIKGKKLPKTYSNYISARMRGPENFMSYWKRAPQRYSCVVAYTITTEGEVEDVMIVEGSNYPDQDALTIELIKALSPVMPPPGIKGNIRVTELFWNGSLDPAGMPTELQKEMVTHFDGRYMEEEP